MNNPKYNGRLPALRVSAKVIAELQARADKLNITLAEAHRQALAQAVNQKVLIPIVGRIDDKGDVQWFDAEAIGVEL